MNIWRGGLFRDLSVIMLVFAAVHGTFALFASEDTRANESLDFIDFYYPIAQRLSDGLGLAEAHYFEHMGQNPSPTQRGEGVFVTRFPPGYSLILAPVIMLADAIGITHADAFIWLSRGFALASVLLLYAIFRLSFGRSLIGLAAAHVWMFYPPFIFLVKQPNSENPFLVCLFAAILAMMSLRQSVARGLTVGFFLGIAIYLRLAGLFLPVAFAAIVGAEAILRREHVKSKFCSAAIIFVVPYILVLPWVMLVYFETGHFVPVASTGSDLISNSASELLRSIPEDSWLWGEGLRAYVAQKAEGEAVMISFGHELQLLAVKVLRAFYGTFTLRHESLLAIMEAIYLGLTAAGVFVCYWWRIGRCEFHICACLLFLYFLSTAIIGVPLLRYTVPAHALLAGYIGCLITSIATRTSGKVI